MHTEHNPLLAQVPLTVSPFVTLPKAPILPHNYATLPSTLPPSVLFTPPSNSQGTDSADSAENQLPAYVTSASGFRAHPSSIINQNRSLLEQLTNSATEARATLQTWLDSIKERELAEKRRKAPGWLDSDEKMLRPARPGDAQGSSAAPVQNLMDDDRDTPSMSVIEDPQVSDLGAQMDRAFG